MKRLVIAVILMLVPANCWAQQLEVTIDKRIRLDASGTADVWMWSLPPGVIYAQAEGTVWIDEATPPGEYRANVVALIIDWDNQSLEQRQGFVDFTVEECDDDGGPTDPVDPVIPDDRFDNIGQDAHDWAKELGLLKTRAAADNYDEVGSRLLKEQTPFIGSIADSVDAIAELNAEDELIPGELWTSWGLLVNARWQTHVRTVTDAGDFYKAVAAGLGAVR